jgi:hypothetical protein
VTPETVRALLAERAALKRRARALADALAPVPSLEAGEALRDELAVLRGVEWASVSPEGHVACPTCGRTRAYGTHGRSGPSGLALRRWAVCEEVWIGC